jgi:spore coat protein SA
MRIRHILPEPELGVLPANPLEAPLTGVVNGTLQLALRQAANGNQVEIVCPASGSPHGTSLVQGVTIRWLRLWERARLPNYDLRYLLPLLNYMLRAETVDVTHVHDNPFLLAWTRSRAAVLHHHGLVLRGSTMYDRMAQRARRVLCISDHIRREVLRQVAYPSERVVTVYDGLDDAAFIESTAVRSKARAQWNIPQDAHVLLFAGRIAPEKGLHVLLNALHVLRERGQLPEKIQLVVAGTSGLGYAQNANLDTIRTDLTPYERNIATLTRGLPVTFVGNVRVIEMPLFYALGDVFVCPSTWQEPFGRINIEAMAVGLPVIASAVGGIPESVADSSTGLLVPPENAQALAKALHTLIADPTRRKAMGEAGKQRAQQFRWQYIVQQVDALYTQILAESV